MVQRLILNGQIVDEATPPTTGEVWLADIEQPGFGLRLWAGKKGGGKAYSVRVTDPDGVTQRESIGYWDLYAESGSRWSFRFRDGLPTLGDLLEDARVWARDQIDWIKQRPTLDEEEEEQREHARRYARSLTLERAAQLALASMRARGVSQEYRDRLDKLFCLHVPERVRRLAFLSVTEKHVLGVLNSPSLTPGNRRLLRPFFGQIFRAADVLHSRGKFHYYQVRDLRIQTETISDVQAFVSKQPREWFAAIFDRLEREDQKWQQALCLRMYFDFYRVPLSRVMAARWDQTSDVRYTLKSTPSETFRRREWTHSPKPLGVQQFSNRQNKILERIAGRSLRGGSAFWFPSPIKSFDAPINSVDHVWRHILHEFKLPYLSPRHFKIALNDRRLLRERWSEETNAYEPPSFDG